MSGDLRVLANVLISVGGNRLRRADVYFTNSVQRIAYHAEPEFEWQDSCQSEIKPLARIVNAAEVIDGGGLLLMPGAVDTHVHFNTPGYEDREDIEHGSLAAAAGGVTTVADMPCTSVPPVTTLSALESKRSALTGRSAVDYCLWGGISAQLLREDEAEQHIRALAAAGVIGFKCYLTSGMETFGDLGKEELLQAATLVRDTGLPLAVHAEDRDRVRPLEAAARAANRRDWKAYAESRDDLAEAQAVALVCDAARRTGCKVHVVHQSSERGLALVAQAQTDGLNVTAETCPHYLQFTQEDFDRSEISTWLKTAPPVKSTSDRAALWQGLRDGTLAFVTTDHAGCDPVREKSSQNFWEIYGGIPGVEHRVPYLLSEGFLSGKLTLERTLQLLCAAPAEFAGTSHRKGVLIVGADADFALVDLWNTWTVRSRDMHSKGRYTPFEGLQLRAQIKSTWLKGQRIFPDGAATSGSWLGCGGAAA